MADKKVTNLEKLKNATKERKPFIVFDVEATGIMNGNDNHITQIAFAVYDWNQSTLRYELQDNLFMLAKARPDSLAEIEERQRPTRRNAERMLKGEYVYAYRNEINRVVTNCLNRQKTITENTLPKYEGRLAGMSARAVKGRENLERLIKEQKDKLAREKALEEKLRDLYHYFEKDGEPLYARDIEEMSVSDINAMVNTLKEDDVYNDLIGTVITKENTFYNKAYILNMTGLMNDAKAHGYSDRANYIKETLDKKCDSFEEYSEKKINEKLKQLREYENLDTVLSSQGIDKNKWISEGLGLTVGEMQTGINEFLKKYKNDNTFYATNGTRYASHYLTKDGVVIPGINGNMTIDLIQAEKSRGNGPTSNRWSANIGDFAEIYKSETSKEIKTFDAYTKALCFAEMVSKAANVTISNRSVNQMANAVTEKAMSMDKDYVMSASRASSLNWRIATEYEFNHSAYHFNSLEYVDFGGSKRYIDIDKMFEVNDNFEVTLEGEKEPIKTWEELENKIKALNSNISEQLLDKIKDKFMEIEGRALKDKHERWETEYNEGTLTRDNMSAEQYQYLDAKYDIEEKEDNPIPIEEESLPFAEDEEVVTKNYSIIIDDDTYYKEITNFINEGDAIEYVESTGFKDVLKEIVNDMTWKGVVVPSTIKYEILEHVYRIDINSGDIANNGYLGKYTVFQGTALLPKPEKVNETKESKMASLFSSMIENFDKESEIKEKQISVIKSDISDMREKKLNEMASDLDAMYPYIKSICEKSNVTAITTYFNVGSYQNSDYDKYEVSIGLAEYGFQYQLAHNGRILYADTCSSKGMLDVFKDAAFSDIASKWENHKDNIVEACRRTLMERLEEKEKKLDRLKQVKDKLVSR